MATALSNARSAGGCLSSSSIPKKGRRPSSAVSRPCSCRGKALADWTSAIPKEARQGSTARRKDGDAFISTTFLTVIYTFALSEQNKQNAYLTAYDDAIDHARSPIIAGSGIQALRFGLGVFDQSTVWKAVISASDDGRNSFTGDESGATGLPQAFVDLCELDNNSTSGNNRYHFILRHLIPLLHLDPSSEGFVKLIAFGRRTWQYFSPLLAQRDPRALLLLSYWFALLTQLDQWWVTNRARSECLAIATYLATLRDAGIQALLLYPRSFGKADKSYLWRPLSSLREFRDNSSETSPD